MSPIDELSAMNTIDEVLNDVNDPDAINRILTWVNSKRKFIVENEDIIPSVEKKKTKSAKKVSKRKSKITKATISKNLNLKPEGKDSFVDFSNKKNPKSIEQKVVVSVYYLEKELKHKEINQNDIYTCFKKNLWKMPSDFMNALHRAGNKGWLDTQDRNDITMTIHGEDLIERDLSNS